LVRLASDETWLTWLFRRQPRQSGEVVKGMDFKIQLAGDLCP